MVSEWAREGQSRPVMRSERARPMQSSRVEAEEVAGGVVEEGDAALGVGDDDAFVDGVEDGLEKAFLAGEPQEVVLDFLRADAADALDEFFEEAGGHACFLLGGTRLAGKAVVREGQADWKRGFLVRLVR